MFHPQLQQHLEGFVAEKEQEDESSVLFLQRHDDTKSDDKKNDNPATTAKQSKDAVLDQKHSKTEQSSWSSGSAWRQGLSSLGMLTLFLLLFFLLFLPSSRSTQLQVFTEESSLLAAAITILTEETSRQMPIMTSLVLCLVAFYLGRASSSSLCLDGWQIEDDDDIRPQQLHHEMHCRIQTLLGSIEAPPVISRTTTTTTSKNVSTIIHNHYLEPMVQAHVHFLQAAQQTLHVLAQVTAWPYYRSSNNNNNTLLWLSSKWEQRQQRTQQGLLPGKRLRHVLWQQLTQLQQLLQETVMVVDMDENEEHGNYHIHNHTNNEPSVLTLAVLRRAWMDLRDALSDVTQRHLVAAAAAAAAGQECHESKYLLATQQATVATAYLESWRQMLLPLEEEEDTDKDSMSMSNPQMLRDLVHTQDVLDQLQIGLYRLADHNDDNDDHDTANDPVKEWDCFRLVLDKLVMQVQHLEETYFTTMTTHASDDEDDKEDRIHSTNKHQTKNAEEPNEYTCITNGVALRQEDPPIRAAYDPDSTQVFSGQGLRGDNVPNKRRTKRTTSKRDHRHTALPTVDPLVAELNLVAELRRRLEAMPVAPEVQVTTHGSDGEDQETTHSKNPLPKINGNYFDDSTTNLDDHGSEGPLFQSSALVLNELATAIQLHQSTQESDTIE